VDVPFRPNPLAPFPAREGGKFGGVRAGERLTPQTLANPQPTRAGKREPKGRKPPGGVWGVSRSRRLKSASLKKVGLRRP